MPATEFPECADEAFQIAERMHYPLVIKPRISSGSRGLRVVTGFEQFCKFYPLIDRDYPRPILQEFIPLREAVGFVAFYGRDGGLKALCQHKRLHEYPLSGGPSTLRETICDDRLTRISRKLLEHLSWRGPAMVEFQSGRKRWNAKTDGNKPQALGIHCAPYWELVLIFLN